MSFINRLISFIKRNVIKNTRFFFGYALHYFDPNFIFTPHFYTENELTTNLKAGKSLVRYGDGEIYMMNYGSVSIYEDFDPKLRDYLFRGVREYTDDSPYVIGIPQQYIAMPNRVLRSIKLLHCWLPLKVTFQNHFNKTATYFDAHQFYRGDSFERILDSLLIDKHVIVVTRKFNINLIKEAGMPDRHKVSFVETPARDSFKQFDSIKAAILKTVTDPTNTRVLLSAGPASKALVLELVKHGIVAYDLGKGIEAAYRPNTIEQMI